MPGEIDPGRIADDVDQPVERMQAAEQIIVLPVGARQERGEVPEADALQALDALEAVQRAGVLRADAVDQNLVELADLAGAGDRERSRRPRTEIRDS